MVSYGRTSDPRGACSESIKSINKRAPLSEVSFQIGGRNSSIPLIAVLIRLPVGVHNATASPTFAFFHAEQITPVTTLPRFSIWKTSWTVRMTLLMGALRGNRLTSRIRRRRAQDVADTTDSLRAVACIRFVRLRLVGGGASVCHGVALESIQDWMERRRSSGMVANEQSGASLKSTPEPQTMC